jgi:hypothetical protein
MKYPNIDRLYKYYGYSKHSLFALKTRTFWFAKPTSLNDPFDGKIPFDSRLTAEAVKKFRPTLARYNGLSKKNAERNLRQVIGRNGQIDQGFLKVWRTVLGQASKKLEDSGVFCLSECNSSILMWSHYADSHKGFCVEFERNPDNDLGDYNKTCRVKYGTKYPIINPLDPKAYDYKFFWKASGWKYEREWRLWNEQGDVAVPLSVKISAIIFGLKMTAKHKSVIREILPDIQCRQCTKIPNSFRIEIADL